MTEDRAPRIGNRIAPPRFLAFCAITLAAVPLIATAADWKVGVMGGFDIAAVIFFASIIPLLHGADPDRMRESSRRNDANRVMLLVISAVTTLAVMAAIAGEITGGDDLPRPMAALVLATIVLTYLFGNTIYALHYAHLFYLAPEDGDGDSGGLDFEGTDEPVYWDFLYFAFTLGMAFATSDTHICSSRMRRVALGHALNAFAFNLGVIAFTVGVLGG